MLPTTPTVKQHHTMKYVINRFVSSPRRERMRFFIFIDTQLLKNMSNEKKNALTWSWLIKKNTTAEKSNNWSLDIRSMKWRNPIFCLSKTDRRRDNSKRMGMSSKEMNWFMRILRCTFFWQNRLVNREDIIKSYSIISCHLDTRNLICINHFSFERIISKTISEERNCFFSVFFIIRHIEIRDRPIVKWDFEGKRIVLSLVRARVLSGWCWWCTDSYSQHEMNVVSSLSLIVSTPFIFFPQLVRLVGRRFSHSSSMKRRRERERERDFLVFWQMRFGFGTCGHTLTLSFSLFLSMYIVQFNSL